MAYSRQDAGRRALPVPPAAGPETDTLHVDQVHVMHSTTGGTREVKWFLAGTFTARLVRSSVLPTERTGGTATDPHNSGPSRAGPQPNNHAADHSPPPSPAMGGSDYVTFRGKPPPITSA